VFFQVGPTVGTAQGYNHLVRLTEDKIDIEEVFRQVQDPRAGAVNLFVGTVRESSANRKIQRLEFEAFGQMAENELQKLLSEATTRFGLCRCAVVHRLGVVPMGEIIMVVAVAAAHRHEAFQATQWLVEGLKRVVPIWKKEIDLEGNAVWVEALPEPSASEGKG
jgi:molybdopterin synthase catalytic subunit